MLLSLGCSRAPKAERESCESAVASGEHQHAAEVCAQEHARTGELDAAEAAMRAYFAHGDDAQTLHWSERLQPTERAGTAWAFAALVHQRNQRCKEQVDAYERARTAFVTDGELVKAAKAAEGQAHCHWVESDFRRAFELFDLAMRHAREAGADELEGKLAYNLRAVLMDVGDLAGARWALERAKARVDSGDTSMQARLRMAEGNLELAEGNLALSRLDFEDAIRLANESDNESIRLKARLNLIDLDLAEGATAAAATRLAELEASPARHQDNARTRTVLQLQSARLAVAQGNDPEALRTLETALARDELLPEWEWQLRSERGQILARRGDRANARTELEASIAVVEELRSQLGFEAFKEGVLEQRRAPLEALFRLEVAAEAPEAALEVSERSRARAFLDAIATERDTRPSVAPDAEAMGQRFEDLRALWRRGRSTAAAPVRPWVDVRAELGDVDALVYFQAEESLFVFAWRDETLVLQRLPFSVEEIERLVSDWIAALDEPEPNRAVAQAILPPELLPPPGRPLVIVPDGALNRVPFAALLRERYLVEDHAITYAPSLGLLAGRRSRDADAPEGPPVVLGDSVQDLPQAAVELRAVAARLGVEPRLGARADREGLVAAARAPLLHVATHGGLDARGPWLQLADGRVHAFELLSEGVSPHVAVIASCASAARRGRGLWGSLGSSFLAAGSRSVVATAWSIEDANARRFVQRFYESDGAARPARGVATTQRSFIAAGEPVSTWGAYVVLGSPRLPNRQERTP